MQFFATPPFGVCLSGGQTGPATPVGCAPGIGRYFDNRPSVSNTSYAFYGQASYEISPKLTLTGGLRYSHDRKYSEGAHAFAFSGRLDDPETPANHVL